MVSLFMLEIQVKVEDIVETLLEWHRSEEGQDLVEYGLLASFISIAAVATIALVGPYLQSLFAYVISQLQLT